MLGPFATASRRTPHSHSPGVATVARRLRIDVHNNDDDNHNNAWQRGPLWPHMGPIMLFTHVHVYRDLLPTCRPYSVYTTETSL